MRKRHPFVLGSLLALGLVLLLGGTASAVTPVLTGGGNHTAVIRSDGTLWTAGLNANGQLGLGDTASRTVLTQVGTETAWVQVSSGLVFTAAVKRDGSLWTWGINDQGQLGTGNTTQQIVPTRVGTDSDWASVACGQDFTLAVKSSGTLWAWGDNQYGQLGDGTTADKLTPVRVGVDSDWAAVRAGNNHSLAVRRDASLWAWGRNNNGQLGYPTTGAMSTVPQIVDTASDWATVSAATGFGAGLKSTGKLWTWGLNASGQLGVGSTTNQPRPTAVGTTADWAAVSAGGNFLLGIKRDHSLWATGLNTASQLGLGDTTNRSSFTQVGTSQDWVMTGAGNGHSLGARIDSILLTWGLNTSGQLGIGSAAATAAGPTSTNFKLDVSGPVTQPSKNVTVIRGKKAKLRYSVSDDFAPWCVNVKIRIRKGSRIVKTFNIGQVTTFQAKSKTFTVKLNKGLYRWYVYATDTAGNVQSAVGFKNLRVR
jgi:alpha-tubulin suppressor-like RCC1 family protein